MLHNRLLMTTTPSESPIEFLGSRAFSISGSNSGSQSLSLTHLEQGTGDTPKIGDTIIALYAQSGPVVPNKIQVVPSFRRYAYTDVVNLHVSMGRLTSNGFGSPTVGYINSGDTMIAGALMVMFFRGLRESSPLTVVSAGVSEYGNGNVNPPAISGVTPGSLVLGVGAVGFPNAAHSLSAPDSEWFRSIVGFDNSSVALGAGFKEEWAANSDPAAWSMPSGLGWIASTIALHPA